MASADMSVYIRTRRMWLVRLAALTGSERVFGWAVRRLRVQTRLTERGKWKDSSLRTEYVHGSIRIV